MAGFYKEYNKTANKAIALHNSKQDYLNDDFKKVVSLASNNTKDLDCSAY
jgi:hypothetical protein